MALKDESGFTTLNPNELPPEVLPFYKSMQADYTRKTQEIKAQIEAANARAEAAEQQLQQITSQMESINDYIARLEDANAKWLAYYEEQEKLEQAKRSATAQPQGAQPTAFTAEEQKVLAMNPGKFTEDQLKQLDEYFEAKYGKSFQTLSAGMDKLSKQLGFKLQMDDVIRQWSRDIKDIDPQRILEAAVKSNTLDAREAFERAYAKELRDLEVEREVARRLEEAKAAEKTKVVEGVSGILNEHFYTRPEGAFSTYEEATAAALKELAAEHT